MTSPRNTDLPPELRAMNAAMDAVFGTINAAPVAAPLDGSDGVVERGPVRSTKPETFCIWDDCGSDAIYCEGHAREYMQPDIDKLHDERKQLVAALRDVMRDQLKTVNLHQMAPGPRQRIEAARALLRSLGES